MNVGYLFQHFTTSPSSWTQTDISFWLELLNMKEYQNQFELNKIDGLIIFDIEDQEMQDILGIQNSIHRKRLRNGIKILREFKEQFDHQSQYGRGGGVDERLSNSRVRKVNLSAVSKNNRITQVKRKDYGNIFSENVLSSEFSESFSRGHLMEELNVDEGDEDEEEVDELTQTQTQTQASTQTQSQSNRKSKLKSKAIKRQKATETILNKENFNSQVMNVEEFEGRKINSSEGLKNSRHTRKSPIFFHEEPIFSGEAQSLIEELMSQEVGAELIIQPIDGIQTNNFYCINDKGGKIGRHSNNEIVILEESVSRYHALIEYKEDRFSLVDTGSTTGTFLKIVNPVVLQEEMIIEMGSNQFYVDRITIYEDEDGEENGELKLKVIEGLYADREFVIKNCATIGRKGKFSSTTLAFNEDLHFSNTHAKISLINSQFILEDLGSTNGSWLRMSAEGERSESYELTDQVIFKIGASCTFKVKRSNTNYLEMMQDSKGPGEEGSNCAICYENDRDVVFIPCKHNVTCIKCCKNLKVCPVCRVKITDIMKIYRS